MHTLIFSAFAVLSFLYWGILAFLSSPRCSVLYFWLLLGGFFTACAIFPFLWYVLCIPFFLFFSLFFLFLFFALKKKDEKLDNPDVFLLLGCRSDGTLPSTILENRVKKAVSLLKSYPDSLCILSGGKVFGENQTEAQILLEMLLREGISPHRLVLEEKSRTTAENFRFFFSLLPPDCSRPVVVTSSYHCFRARMTAHSFQKGTSLCFAGAPAPKIFLPHLFLREWFTFSVDLILGNIKQSNR